MTSLALVADYGVVAVVVAVADRRGKLPVEELMHVKLSGVKVEEAATTYERLTGKLMLENLTPSSLIFSDGFGVLRWRRRVKRAADILLSSVGLVLGAVPMALTALIVWLESGRPVIYRQERVGRARAALHASSSSARCASTPKATSRCGRQKATRA